MTREAVLFYFREYRRLHTAIEAALPSQSEPYFVRDEMLLKALEESRTELAKFAAQAWGD